MKVLGISTNSSGGFSDNKWVTFLQALQTISILVASIFYGLRILVKSKTVVDLDALCWNILPTGKDQSYCLGKLLASS